MPLPVVQHPLTADLASIGINPTKAPNVKTERPGSRRGPFNTGAGSGGGRGGLRTAATPTSGNNTTWTATAAGQTTWTARSGPPTGKGPVIMGEVIE